MTEQINKVMADAGFRPYTPPAGTKGFCRLPKTEAEKPDVDTAVAALTAAGLTAVIRDLPAPVGQVAVCIGIAEGGYTAGGARLGARRGGGGPRPQNEHLKLCVTDAHQNTYLHFLAD